MIPLALGLGRPGDEIEAPMAIAVLGGLTTATLLNLGILPETLIRLGRYLGIPIETPPPSTPIPVEPVAPASQDSTLKTS